MEEIIKLKSQVYDILVIIETLTKQIEKEKAELAPLNQKIAELTQSASEQPVQ